MRRFLIVLIIAVLALTFPTPSESRLTANESSLFTSLRLKLSGPSLVAAGELPNFRAALINDSNQDVRLPSLESLRNIIYLQWRVTDFSEHTIWTRWSGVTICGPGKEFTEQDFATLEPGQRLELPDVGVPSPIRDAKATSRYKISLRYAFPHPDAVLLPDDILSQKSHFDLTSNELIVLVTEK